LLKKYRKRGKQMKEMEKEMEKVENFIGKTFNKCMNVKSTPKEHLIKDAWFTGNLLCLALSNLIRFSKTTQDPDAALKSMLELHLKKMKIKYIKLN
tara:strand:- start:1121 stop:1408 length:288 start_codon:yes stop_codon:yes gene_type:complete